MEVNVSTSDSKSGFQSYLSQYNCNYPAVLGSEGGRDISMAVGNGGGGNSKYMIYPDKTYSRYSSIPSTVMPHDCNPNPSITVEYPNGGEIISKGSIVEILWSSKNFSNEVKIELLKNNSVEEILSLSEENDGSFLWNLSSASSTGNAFEIRISSLSNLSIQDKSDGYFSISEEIIISGEYLENFDTLESGSGDLPIGYSQSVSDDFDWLVLSGPTPSKNGPTPNVTGPDGDHTSGGADGMYLYVEASDPNNPGKVTQFETPKVDISNIENPELTFYYHMFSDTGDMGSLDVDVWNNNAWSDNELVLDESDYGDEWHKASVNLNDFKRRAGVVKIRFTGITGNSWASDICIDDIEIKGNPVALYNKQELNQKILFNVQNSKLNISFPKELDYKNIQMSIFNMQGKKVFDKKSEVFGIMSVNLREINLADGIYSINISMDEFNIKRKFIVTR